MRFCTFLIGVVSLLVSNEASGKKTKGGGVERFLHMNVKEFQQDYATLTWEVPEEHSKGKVSICWKKLPAPKSVEGNCSVVDVGLPEMRVDDLKPCAWYEFIISALNKAGERTSESYSLRQFISRTVEEPPENVPEFKVYNGKSNYIELYWESRNTSVDSCFSHFTTCAHKSDDVGGDKCEKTPSFETGVVLNDLELCSNYSITSWVSTLDGLQSDNQTLHLTTGPGDVSDVRTVDLTPESVIIKWTAPARGRECLAYYRLRFERKMSPEEGYREVNVSADESQYLIANLTCCTAVNILLSSVSFVQTQSNISYLQVATRGSAPGEVEDLEVTHTSSSSIHLQWKVPTERFNCLLRYSVCWQEEASDLKNCSLQKLDRFPKHSIYGLKPCTNYTIMVGALGAEKLMGNATIISQFTGPERVHIVKPVLSILGPHSVAIKWQDTPCADQFSVCWGSWPDRVLYTCHTDTHTNLTVTDLQPTTKYTFILTALGSNRERSDPFVFAVLMPKVKPFKSGRT